MRSPSGAPEDRNDPGLSVLKLDEGVAVALRADRGSQQGVVGAVGRRREELRWPSGAPEDRNTTMTTAASETTGWRLPSGATEDRNPVPHSSRKERSGGRPLGRSRIATSRSPRGTSRPDRMAVVLRGARGSQHRLEEGRMVCGQVAVAPWGDRGSQLCTRVARARPPRSGGRPPGRPRIATTATGPRPGTAAKWRSSSGDRGSQLHPGQGRSHREYGGGRPPGQPRIATLAPPGLSSPSSRVAVALRGDRGIATPSRTPRPGPRRWRRSPFGGPRIATSTSAGRRTKVAIASRRYRRTQRV